MAPASGHCETVYGTRVLTSVSWYEEGASDLSAPERGAAVTRDVAVVDVGGGASFLVDALLDRGASDVTVLDVSVQALDVLRARLGRIKDVSLLGIDVLLEVYDRGVSMHPPAAHPSARSYVR